MRVTNAACRAIIDREMWECEIVDWKMLFWFCFLNQKYFHPARKHWSIEYKWTIHQNQSRSWTEVWVGINKRLQNRINLLHQLPRSNSLISNPSLYFLSKTFLQSVEIMSESNVKCHDGICYISDVSDKTVETFPKQKQFIPTH